MEINHSSEQEQNLKNSMHEVIVVDEAIKQRLSELIDMLDVMGLYAVFEKSYFASMRMLLLMLLLMLLMLLLLLLFILLFMINDNDDNDDDDDSCQCC